MTESSLAADGLTKTFPGTTALNSATFRYDGRGAIGYLGPNGAGKTTTLKLLTGLLRPTSGAAYINGVNVAEDRKRALGTVGAVIESPEPYPTQTVHEAIEMAGEFRGGLRPDLRREIAELDARLELPPSAARCGRLSKGQRQRVAIAGALVADPRILLLDEPTAGLDPKERILIRNLLNDLKKDHLILMSSHLMAEVSEICSQVIFINEGRILLRDSVDSIANRFRSTAVEVEFASPLAVAQVQALGPPVLGVQALSDRRFRVAFDGSTTARAELLRRLGTVGAVVSFQSASLVLEDAYLALIQGDGLRGTP